MKTQDDSIRVRIEWTDGSKTQVMAVPDPNGAYILNQNYQGCIWYKPKTEYEILCEDADSGKIPLASDSDIEAQYSHWDIGYTIPGGSFCIDGVVYYPPKIYFLDYWNHEDGKHTCPKRVVIDGILYNIPQPTEPPSDEDWGQQLPLGGFEVWVPASPLVSPIIVDSLTEFPNEDENRLVLGGIKEGDEPRTASVSATIRIQGGVAYFPPTNEQLEVWSREPIPVHWENSQNGSRLWRYFTPVYKGTWKWRWMKIKKWFSRIK